MDKKINKFIYWAPRILGILFVLFLAMFSLDIFDGNYGFWGTIVGLFMHNIPALILLAVVIISWKHELVGGIVFTLAGLLYVGMTMINDEVAWSFIVAGPALLVGILFLFGWRQKKWPTDLSTPESS